MADDLTPTDYAFLILLKIEGRDISNTDLHNAHGVRLVGKDYARLNGRGYVDSRKEGSTYWHQLSKSGKKLLRGQLVVTEGGVETKKDKGNGGAKQLWAALSAMHNDQLNRLPASEPNGHHGLEDQIRTVYTELATPPGAWVSLTRLRPRFGDVPKHDLDKALVRLLADPDVSLEPEDNQKNLKEADHAAAVNIGGEDRHVLAIGLR